LRDILEEKRWERKVQTLGSTVSKMPSLVRPGGLGCPVDQELVVLPATHFQQEVQLLHVLVGFHLVLLEWIQQKYNDIVLIYLTWISWADRDSPVREG